MTTATTSSIFSTAGGSFSKLLSRRAALVDLRRAAMDEQVTDQTRQIAFTFSVIALSQHLVRMNEDGNAQRYLAFREAFPAHASEDAKIRSLFDLAAKENLAPDCYVKRIMRLFPAKPALHADVISRLLSIAAASGSYSIADYNYVQHLARQFGIRPREFKSLARRYGAPKVTDPYAILGVRRYWSVRAIKAAQLRLLKQYHPDRFRGQGASDEMVERMTQRVAEINQAYALIAKQRRSLAWIGR